MTATTTDTTSPPTYPAYTPPTEVLSMSELRELVEADWFGTKSRPRDTCDPDAVRHDNTRRAGWAAAAVLTLAEQTGLLGPGNDEAPETAIGDLLANLRHLCDLLGGADFDKLNDNGAYHYHEEVTGH
jgi:hypothetical protein